jgi:tight adherence protein B
MSTSTLWRLVLGGVAASLGLTLTLAGAAKAADEPSARIDSVEVTEGHASFVLTTANLSADAVRVEVGGAPVPAKVTPLDTQQADAPTRAVVVVLDASGSMAGDRLVSARQAAASYAAGLPSDVQVGLVEFATKPALLVAPTTDRAAFTTALNAVAAKGDTALYDAIPLAVSAMAGVTQRRLVVLSDGEDTKSATALDAGTELLAREQVPADVVALQYNGITLQRIAAAGGGRVLEANDAAQLGAAFATAARSFTQRTRVELDVPRELAGRAVDLAVTVTAGTTSLTASAPITFAALPAIATDQPAQRPSTWNMGLTLLLGGTFVVLLLLGVVLFGFSGRRDAGRTVVDQVERYGARRDEIVVQPESLVSRTALGLTTVLLGSGGRAEALAERLDLAGMKASATEWTLLRLCGCVGLSAVAAVVTGSVWIGAVVGLVLGWLGTRWYVSFKASRRRAAFGDQLPDVLQLVAGSLQSGFSLAQSLDAVVRDGTQPAAGEFSRALAETRIGVGLEDALDHIAERMSSDDLRWVVMAIRIQRSVGGNLAEVLLTTVATMRERAQTRRQVRALSAEGRLSGYILVAMPITLAGWLFLARRDYLRPLYTTSIGLVLLSGAAVLVVLGALWMRKLIKVEV